MSTEITRLKSLKRLSLECAVNLTAFHIIDILNECRQLKMVSIESTLQLSLMNLFDILRFGRSMETFNCMTVNGRIGDDEKINIDAAAYIEMVNIVKSRSTAGVKMTIRSFYGLYVNAIPVDLLEKHRNVLNVRFVRMDKMLDDEEEDEEEEEGEEVDGEEEGDVEGE